jgi:small-conductance mechanosensitive channel
MIFMSSRLLSCRKLVAAALLAGPLLSIAVRAGDSPNHAAVLSHLSAVITWYRDLTTKGPNVEIPSDAIFQDNLQALAAETVQLAFQSARAEVALAADSNPAPAGESGGEASSATNYAQMQIQVSQRITDSEAKIDTLNKQIPTAPNRTRNNLIAERDALVGSLTLDKAMLDAVGKMAAFVETTSENRKGFEGSINEMARSVPEVVEVSPPSGVPSAKEKAAQAKAAVAAAPNSGGEKTPAGLIGQVVGLYGELNNVRTINRLLAESERLRQSATDLRAPLRDSLRATAQRGQELSAQAAQNAASNASAPPKPAAAPKAAAAPNGAPAATAPAAPAAESTTKEYADLTRQFNHLSAALLPLSQELVVLDQSRSNLNEWKRAITEQSKHNLVSVLFRVGSIALALVIVLVLSDIWRRLTFRYIKDARRRRQFLVLRRFVVGFLIGVVLIMGFVSEFSSLATYAGFVTAGIAVGLQTLLLSVAAYFFVIGRYGIRVGDRISVAGVTGDVVDVGLVRFYLMELAGTGVDLFSTGRIAAFSNSVLFQATTPLFKQIPGTEYAWHEIAATLTTAGDHKLVQEKLMAAVGAVHEKYGDALQPEYGSADDRMEIFLKAPVPEAKLQFVDAGLELVVRYPVDLRRASEMDDLVARALLDAMRSDPAVSAGITGTPRIRAAVKG